MGRHPGGFCEHRRHGTPAGQDSHPDQRRSVRMPPAGLYRVQWRAHNLQGVGCQYPDDLRVSPDPELGGQRLGGKLAGQPVPDRCIPASPHGSLGNPYRPERQHERDGQSVDQQPGRVQWRRPKRFCGCAGNRTTERQGDRGDQCQRARLPDPDLHRQQ